MCDFTYSIFDDDPSVAGGVVWPDHDGEPIDADNAEKAAEAIAAIASDEAIRSGEYAPGDSLWILIWDADDVRVLKLEITIGE